MPFVVSVAQQKGGVGKTSIAASLFAAKVSGGVSAGIVDLDPQGNATAWALGHGVFNDIPQHAGAEAFTLPHGEIARGYSAGITPEDAREMMARHVHPCAKFGGGFVVPANLYMAPHAFTDIRLDVLPFDVVVVDTPPRLPADVFRAIARQSDAVIAPVQPEAAAVQNVPDLVRELANCGGARLLEENAFRLVVTMAQKCTNHAAWETVLREHFKPYLSRVVIARATAWGELLNPNAKWNPKSAPAKAAAELWKEIERNAARRVAA
jgi:chromosome partitioning protein